jgi:hypothetical protein
MFEYEKKLQVAMIKNLDMTFKWLMQDLSFKLKTMNQYGWSCAFVDYI